MDMQASAGSVSLVGKAVTYADAVLLMAVMYLPPSIDPPSVLPAPTP